MKKLITLLSILFLISCGSSSNTEKTNQQSNEECCKLQMPDDKFFYFVGSANNTGSKTNDLENAHKDALSQASKTISSDVSSLTKGEYVTYATGQNEDQKRTLTKTIEVSSENAVLKAEKISEGCTSDRCCVKIRIPKEYVSPIPGFELLAAKANQKNEMNTAILCYQSIIALNPKYKKEIYTKLLQIMLDNGRMEDLVKVKDVLVQYKLSFNPPDSEIQLIEKQIDTKLKLQKAQVNILLGKAKKASKSDNTIMLGLDFIASIVSGNKYLNTHITPGISLKKGTYFKIVVNVNAPIYLYIINIDSKGLVSPIFPHPQIPKYNPIQKDNYFYLPDRGGEGNWFELTGSSGFERFDIFVFRNKNAALEGIMKKMSTSTMNADTLKSELDDVLQITEKPKIITRFNQLTGPDNELLEYQETVRTGIKNNYREVIVFRYF